MMMKIDMILSKGILTSLIVVFGFSATAQTMYNITVTVFLDGTQVDAKYQEAGALDMTGKCFFGIDEELPDGTVQISACGPDPELPVMNYPGDELFFSIYEPSVYALSSTDVVTLDRWEVVIYDPPNPNIELTYEDELLISYEVLHDADISVYLTSSEIVNIQRDPVSARWAPDAARRSGGKLLWGPAYQTAKSQVTDVDSEGFPSLLYSGEAFEKQVDFAVTGRGLDFVFSRVHRSGNPTGGGDYFGNGWTHNFDIVAQATGENVQDPINVSFGNGTTRTFYLKYYVGTSARYYYSLGWDAELRLVFDVQMYPWTAHYELEFGDGVAWIFPQFDYKAEEGSETTPTPISSINDRYWVLNTEPEPKPEPVNKMTFSYDGEGRLQTISDTVGRTYTFAYKDGTDLIDTLTENDGLGRVIKYDYDNDSHLISVTYPATTAHPAPDEPKISYTYDGGRLSTVTDSRDNVVLTNHYDLSTGVLISQDFGVGDDIAIVHYDYAELSLENGENHAIRVTDGTGNITEHYFNDKNQRVRFVRLVDDVPLTTYTTWLAYDFEGITVSDDLPKASILPDGTIISYTYAAEAPTGLDDLEFRYRMNLLGSERLASNGSGKKVIEVFGHNFTDFWDARFGESFQTCHSVRDEADNVLRATTFIYSDDGQGTLNGINYYGINAYSAAGEQSFTDYELATEEILSLMTAPDSLYVAEAMSSLAAGESIYEALSVPLLTASAGIYYESESMLLAEATSKDSKTDKDKKSKKTKKLDKITTEASGDHHESFGYNVFGQVVEHLHPNNQDASDSDPVTRKDTFDYNASGYLITQTIDNTPSQENLITTYAPDAVGRVEQITDPKSNVTNIAYDELDQVLEVELPILGSTSGLRPKSTYVYDKNGNVDESHDLWFDDAGNPVLVNGNDTLTTDYVYDTRNRVIEVKREVDEDIANDDEWNITKFIYDGNNNVIEEQSPLAVIVGDEAEPNNVISYQYDERNLPIRIARSKEITTRFDYDTLGRVVNSIEGYGTAKARVTRYNYNGLGYLYTQSDAAGLTTEFVRDALGREREVIAKEGTVVLAQTNYDYDPVGRLTNVRVLHKNEENQNVGDGWLDTILTYTDAGLLKMESFESDETYHIYDTAMRLIETRSNLVGDKDVLQYDYDDNNNIITQTETAYNTGTSGTDIFISRFGYDELDRLVSVGTDDSDGSSSDAKTTLYAYDSLNQLVQETDPRGNISRNIYDALGRLTQTEHNPDLLTPNVKAIITYAYDANDRLKTITDPLNNETKYFYDVFNRLVLTEYADGQIETFAYDVLDNITEHVAPGGITTNVSYDQAGRPVAQTFSQLAGRLSPGDTAYDYDVLSRITAAHTANTTITHQYDTLGNLAQEIIQFDGTTLKPLKKTYDDKGQLSELNSLAELNPGDDLNVLTYTYDANNSDGRVMGVLRDGLQVATFEYLGARPSTRMYGDEIAPLGFSYTAYEDTGQRPDSIDHRDSTNITKIDTRDYTWDNGYNLDDYQITDGDLASSAVDYSYDALNRLDPASPGVGAAWSYDKAGNREQSGVYDLWPNALMHRYTTANSLPYYYDTQGALVRIGADADSIYEYHYDANNRLVQYHDITVAASDPFSTLDLNDGNWSVPPGAPVLADTWDDINGYLEKKSSDIGAILYQPDPLPVGFTFEYRSPHDPNNPDDDGTPEEYRDDDYPAKYYAQVLLVVDTTGGLPYPYIALRIEPDQLSVIKYDGTTISELESVSVSTKANTWYKVDVRPVSGGPDSGSLSIQITNNEEAGDAVALLSVSTEELNITSNALGFTMGELAKYEFKLGDYTIALDASETFIDWTYDAYGRKIAESVYNGATLSAQTLYVWDGWRLLAEVDGTTGNTIAEYVPGPGYIDDIVASCRDLNSSGGFETGEYFYHLTDQQYSTVALLNDTGAVVERYRYDAFGTPLFYEGDGTPRTGSTESLVNNPYLYTGQRWMPGLSLYDYRNRMYDPDTGRFITTDLTYDRANLGNPYSYVGNNPGAFVDPNGDIAETVWDAASLGIGLGSLGYNLWHGRFLDASLDTIGITADAVATAIPFIPGGAGIAIKGYRVAKVAQTLQRVDTAISVGQGVVAGGQAIYEGDTVGAGVAVLQTAIVGSRAAGEIVRNPRIMERLSDNTGTALNPFAKGALRKAGRETSVITDSARLLPGPSQGKLNAIRGNKFQRSANAALGVQKRNTTSLSGLTRSGKQINVEPDLLGSRFGVTEIRDRVNASFTRQMQAEADIARQVGTSFNLVVSPRTQTVSVPLREAIELRGGIIVEYNQHLNRFSSVNFDLLHRNRILR